MNDQDGAVETADRRISRRRRVMTGIALVLACLSIVVTTVGIWTHQVALNTNRFSALIESVVTDPAIVEPVSARISTQVVDALDVQGRLETRLPDALKPLAGALTASVRNAIDTRLRVAFQDPRIQAALVNSLSFTHTQVVRLLRDEFDAVGVADGYVTLDVFPVVGTALTELQTMGIIPGGRAAPRPDGPGSSRGARPAPRVRARCDAPARLRDDPADARRPVAGGSLGRPHLRPGRHPARHPDHRPRRAHAVAGAGSTPDADLPRHRHDHRVPGRATRHPHRRGRDRRRDRGRQHRRCDAGHGRHDAPGPSGPHADHRRRDGGPGGCRLPVGPPAVGDGDDHVRRRRGRACRIGGRVHPSRAPPAALQTATRSRKRSARTGPPSSGSVLASSRSSLSGWPPGSRSPCSARR